MIGVNLIVILLYALLAIISRKHFSKYKDRHMKGGFVSVVFMAMGRTIYRLVYKYIPMERIRSRLRKIQVVSKEALDDLAEEYVVKNAAMCLFVMLICSVMSMAAYAFCSVSEDQASNIIEREDYSGDVTKHNVYLTVDGQTSVYELEVQPKEYTEQEFLQQAQEVEAWLSTEILGTNESADFVTDNLYLPEKDKTNCFSIQWHSNNPDIVTSYGKVEWDLLTEDVVVVMTATVSYLDYSVDYEYPVCIRPYSSEEEEQLSVTKKLLNSIEKDNRTNSYFVIPDKSQEVEISLGTHEEGSALKWVFLGVIGCIMLGVLQKHRLDESIKNRDKELNIMYSGFVSRICMLLETGLTLRGSLEHIAYELRGHSTLKHELLYMVHELKMGKDESTTYTAFATRIGLPIYSRLMNHINQNLRVGTQNLVRVLEEEVAISLEMRNEYMKKQGEEVSTKLLFPMMVLLLIVMFIVMFPAMQNF